MNNIKDRVGQILKEKNLTKKWLSEKIDVSVGNLNRTISNISLEKLMHVADSLDMSI
ncbi:MAG: helix-turn-helix domain-containing protein [Dysgonomonas sp.]